MALDDQLLKKAQRQGEALAEAERQAQLARADYHTAVRRLHLAGGSLREVAQALGLSHQRVQQIINGAGGTWWHRVWRSRTVRVDAVCTFCERPPSEVAKLIAGPNVYICDACVASAEAVLEPGTTIDTRGGNPLAAARSMNARCSFCGKRRATNRSIVGGPAARICGECLRLCRQILDDRAA
jgi:hypothetical protein